MHAELRATSALQTKVANIIMRDPSSMNVISRAEEIIATLQDALLSDEVVEAAGLVTSGDGNSPTRAEARVILSAALAKIGAQNVER